MTVREQSGISTGNARSPVGVDSRSVEKAGIAGALRRYVYALILQCAVMGLIYLGDRFLVKEAFPWATVSLLVVAATAALWGRGPALVTVVTAALFGDLLVPDLHISILAEHTTHPVTIIRTLLFLTCSGMIVGLAEQMRRMYRSAEQRRTVLQSLQGMILPPYLPSPPGWETAWHYRPASVEDEVGGDFYDVFHLENGQYGVIVGDVMGKGKEAAMHTADLRYSLRAYLAIGWRPSEALAQVDRMTSSDWSDGATASVFVGRLDPKSGILTYANAGHESPLAGRPGDTPRKLSATGPILGTGIAFDYSEASIELEHGELLLLFTDGVTEARNQERQFLDSSGTWQLLRQASGQTQGLAGILDAMVSGLIHYTSGIQHDDVALVLLRRR